MSDVDLVLGKHKLILISRKGLPARNMMSLVLLTGSLLIYTQRLVCETGTRICPERASSMKLKLMFACAALIQVSKYECIRLASLGRPWTAPGVRSNSFDVISGAHLGQPPIALLVERVTWGWPEVHGVTTKG